MSRRKSTWEDIEIRIDKSNATFWSGCWIWTGGLDKHGYGVVTYQGKYYSLHRLMYEHYVGKIPDNLELDHWCKNPLCCRPGHLEPVTHKENVLRGTGLAAINAVKTHCPYGHEYTEENTFFILKNNFFSSMI